MAKNVKTESKKPMKLLWMALVFIITAFVFYPSLKNGYTNWDDEVYVFDNKNIQDFSSDNIKKQFSLYHHGNYHPFTMVSYMMDYQAAELNPERYHLTNYLFHLANTLLVFVLVYALFPQMLVAFFTALLFGIHPMHVESVAWISERKDVLYTFFYLLSIIAYLKYLSSETKNAFYYLGAIVLFVCSILSKPAALALSPTLLAIDYIKNRPFDKKFFLDKIPFFALSIGFGLVAIKAQQATESIASFEVFTVWQRIMFASFAFLTYIRKILLPFDLSCFHPYPFLIGDRLPYIYYAAPFILLVVLALTVLSIKKTRWVVFAIAFMAFNLVMVLQFISVGNAIVADRYSYVPYIGFFMLMAYAVYYFLNHETESMKMLGKGLLTLMIAMCGYFSYATMKYIKTWDNALSIWDNFQEVYPKDTFGHVKKAAYYIFKDDEENAFKSYSAALQINPGAVKALMGRANIYGKRGKYQEAMQDYSVCIQQEPNNHELYLNRAITYSLMKQHDLAFADFAKAEAIEPDELKIYSNRAFAYFDSGKYPESIADYTKMIGVEPSNFNHFFYRGLCYFNLKDYEKAALDFDAVIKLNPTFSAAWNNRSASYFNLNKYKEAYSDALKAQELGFAVNPAYLENVKSKL